MTALAPAFTDADLQRVRDTMLDGPDRDANTTDLAPGNTEEDPFVQDLVRRFGGQITSITDAPKNWQNLPRVWTTTVHPRHIRRGWFV
jgi:hypothetical protein